MLTWKEGCTLGQVLSTLAILTLKKCLHFEFIIDSHSTDILGQIILGCRGWPVHCRMFCDIPDFYPLDARSTPFPRCDNQNVFGHCQMNVPWEAELSLVESHRSRAIHQKGTQSGVTTVGT